MFGVRRAGTPDASFCNFSKNGVLFIAAKEDAIALVKQGEILYDKHHELREALRRRRTTPIMVAEEAG